MGKRNFAITVVEFSNGIARPILLELKDLTIGIPPKNDIALLVSLTKHLDTYKEYWDKCTYFLIEQQMSFGKKRNPNAILLSHHCISYFTFHYANTRHIIEFPAYHKTKVFDQTKMTKPERKKWTIAFAIKRLTEMNEPDMLNKLISEKKKDDLADVLCQAWAFCIINFKE